MKLPAEILQEIYMMLNPTDFDAARHTCRSWFLAGLDRGLLIRMLQRGGWWISLYWILVPWNKSRGLHLDDQAFMSKWISRECSMTDQRTNAFVEVASTDLSALVLDCQPGRARGTLSFTVSLCGRFLLITFKQWVFVYELNHVCSHEESRWLRPGESRFGFQIGLLRPVTSIRCPREVLACSMDTSAQRYAIALLMQARTGMICNITPERIAPSLEQKGSEPPLNRVTSHSCICLNKCCPIDQPIPTEQGQRSIYTHVGRPDDPPRSVAICPLRDGLAFRCSSGFELH